MEFVEYDPINNVFDQSVKDKGLLLPQIVWHITHECKLKCPFCFAQKDFKNHHYNLAVNVELFKSLGIKKIDISGGEPLLCDELKDICCHLTENGFYLTITTTGFGKVANYEWLLKNIQMFIRIIYSIDGLSEVHDTLRGKKGLFDIALKQIKQIKNINNNKIRINTVVTKKLLESNLDEFIDVINKIAPYEWCLIELHPANTGQAYEELRVDTQYEKFVEKAKAKSNIKIISRSSKDYSDYWVVNANNTISKHSEESEDLYVMEIKKENFQSIYSIISQNEKKYPRR